MSTLIIQKQNMSSERVHQYFNCHVIWAWKHHSIWCDSSTGTLYL